MKVTDLSNDREANLQDYDVYDVYGVYQCAGKYKRRKKKSENVSSPKSEKWMKARSRSDTHLRRYRGISASNAVDEEEEKIVSDLRQDEHYFFDDKGGKAILDKLSCMNFYYRELEKVCISTKVLQKFENKPKRTKIHKELENVPKAKKVHQELENLPKTTKVQQELENGPKTTKVHQELGNTRKNTKGQQELENVPKTTKELEKTTGEISSKLKELDRNAKMKPDAPRRDLYCVICEVQCNSNDSYQDHVRGKRHVKNTEEHKFTKIKDAPRLNLQELEKVPKNTGKITSKLKELDKNADVKLDVLGRDLYCDMCNVQCNSNDSYQGHIRGKRHVKNAAEQFSNNKIKDAPRKNIQELDKMLKNTDQIPSKLNEVDRSVEVKPDAHGRDLYCDMCDVKCNSNNSYQGHVRGWRHAKKMKSDVLYCAMCDVQCSSNDSYQGHVTGKRHAKKKAKQIIADVPKVKDSPRGNIQELGMSQNTCKIPSKLKEVDKNADVKLDVLGRHLYCVMCDVQCYSNDSYQGHVRRKGHIKKAEEQIIVDAPRWAQYNSAFTFKSPLGAKQRAKRAQIKSSEVTCKMCNVFVSSKDMLKSHELGKKHKNMLKKINV